MNPSINKITFYVAVILLLSAQLSFAAKPVGTHVSRIDSWESNIVFKDAFKHCGNWVSGNSTGTTGWDTGVEIPTDSKGWPSVDIPYDNGSDPLSVLQTNIFGIDSPYPSGTYTLIYEGNGQVMLGSDAGNQLFTSSGTHSAYITAGEWGINVIIMQSSASDPVRNIRLILPGYADSYQSDPFYPRFIEIIDDFDVVRMIQWNQNGVLIENWADRRTTDYYTQGYSSGVAVEYQIMLCNTIDADPWINIPHRATDDYITQLARYWRDNLETDKTIYIEYTNEAWNQTFPQKAYCDEQGALLGVSGDADTVGYKFYTKRSCEIFKIFEDEFGGDSRLVKIIATHSVNPWCTTTRLDALSDNVLNPNGITVDALACESYFGGYMAGYIGDNGLINSITIDEMVDLARENIFTSTSVVNSVEDKVVANKAYANTYGLDLFAYEGCQHITANDTAYSSDAALSSKIHELTRDERMYDLFIEMFDVWFSSGGGLFMSFDLCKDPSVGNNWGLLEWTDQPISSAPRYRAVVDVMKGSTTVVSNFSGTVHSTSSINWSWESVSAAEGYRVYYSTLTSVDSSAHRLDTNTTWWLQSALTPNTSYSMCVRYYDFLMGTSTVSNSDIVYTLANPPSGLTSLVQSTYTITLSWTSGDGGAARYAVEKSSEGTSWFYIRQWSDGLTDAAVTDSGLTDDTNYWYRIRSYNGDEIITGFSNELMARTTANISAVSVEVSTGVVVSSAAIAAPENFSGAAQSTSSIIWSWDYVSDADGYRVYSSTVSDAAQPAKQLDTNTTSWIRSGLTANTSYSMYVRSFSVLAGTSTVSNGCTVYTLANPPVSLTSVAHSTCTITLSWTAGENGASRFAIEKSSEGTTWFYLKTWNDVFTQTEYINTGLSEDTTYWYRVRAYNGDGVVTAALNEITAKTSSYISAEVPGEEVDSSQGGQVSAVSDAGMTTVVIPSNAADENIKVVIGTDTFSNPIEVDTTTITTANSKEDIDDTLCLIDSTITEFVAYTLAGAKISTSFNSDVTITIPYSADSSGLIDNISTAVNEKTLRIYGLNETTKAWELVSGSSVDTVNKTVSADVSHFSVYALAGEPPSQNLDNVVVYPNPYKPGTSTAYDADYVTFKYLTADAVIKIFNIAGELIVKLTNESGDAEETWDTVNSNGKKAASGVYIYVITSSSGSKNQGKFAIIR